MLKGRAMRAVDRKFDMPLYYDLLNKRISYDAYCHSLSRVGNQVHRQIEVGILFHIKRAVQQ